MTPQTAADELTKLKKRARRRLVGAVVLVLLSYIGLSWILADDPQKNQRPLSQDVQISIPDPNDGKLPPVKGELPVVTNQQVPFSSRVQPDTPSSAPSPAASTSAAASDVSGVSATPRPTALPVLPKSLATPVPSGALSKPSVNPKPSPTPSPMPKPSIQPSATPSSEQFVIQFAALADTEKVRQLQSKLQQQGVKSHTQPIITAQGTLTRVRAGPFKNRSEADATLAKLQAAGIQGKVVAR